MSDPRFLVWGIALVEGACVLDELSDVPDDDLLLDGTPLALDFPPNASYSMHPDFPDDILLTDSLGNADSIQVVSARLAQFLKEKVGRFVEFLPVTIIDHEKRPSDEPYFIVHPLDAIDCLDLARCGPVRSRVIPTQIMDVERLILDESKIDPDRVLFRPAGFARVTLVARELAAALDREGFTGIRWIEPGDYPEL